jgi:transposase-like protein
MAIFVDKYEAKYPKAVDCLTKDREALLTFFDFPAEHWDHLRTSNRSKASSPPSGTAPCATIFIGLMP